ncbi:hypothetical protein ACWGDX_02960 [Streptomyces sp. NPDC055025]
MTEPEPFAQTFRLRPRNGDLIHGVLFPSGPAAVLDDPDVGISAAPDLTTLLTHYSHARIEWADQRNEDLTVRRLRDKDIAEQLAAAGHEHSEFEAGPWDPGFRVAQHGPRIVRVFHDGPDEEDHLAAYTTTLHQLGYAVVPEQERGGQRLAVTRP